MMKCYLKIHTKDAVCLKRIADSGQCFRWTSVDDGFLIPYREHDLFVRQDDPFTLMMSCTEDEYHFLWKDYFDLETDYDALCSNISIESDPFLFEAIREQRGIRI